MFRVMIPAIVSASEHEGVTVTVKTVRGEQNLLMDPMKILPGFDMAPTPDWASWMGMAFEHQSLCPVCDKGKNPMCARAKEIAEHLPLRNPQAPFEKWT